MGMVVIGSRQVRCVGMWVLQADHMADLVNERNIAVLLPD
jgi:hypothetical protein